LIVNDDPEREKGLIIKFLYCQLLLTASDKNSYAVLRIKISSGTHTLENKINCKRKTKILSLKIDTLLRLLN
jgi:hypothetical protein